MIKDHLKGTKEKSMKEAKKKGLEQILNFLNVALQQSNILNSNINKLIN